MNEQFTEESSVPSYLLAADTHNLANKNYSFFDTAVYGTGAVLGSALVQTYNILPTIGNWLGGDFEHAKAKEVLQDFDTDMGQYYQDHQDGVDALGFVLSSLVPGTGGVKVFRAGQTMLHGAMKAGTLGTNLQAATGLLPSRQKLLSQAVESALKPNAGFPVWNADTIKSIVAGAGQAAMEGAAFETAVAATMYNSPLLQDKDFGDITSNILWGAGLAGVVGGGISAAQVYHKIRSAGRAIDQEMMAVTRITELPNAPANYQILNHLEDMHYTVTETPLANAGWTGENAWKMAKFESLRGEKVRVLEDKIRKLTGTLADGDEVVATHLYNKLRTMPLEQAEAKLFGTSSITRLGQKSPDELRLVRLEKQLASKNAAGSIDDPLAALKAEDQAFWATRERVYVKLTGEGAGDVVSEAPSLWRLGDKLRKGETISVSSRGVSSAGMHYKFGLDIPWDASGVSHFEVEARQIWASKTNVFAAKLAKNEPIVIGENDIPLLDKAYIEGVMPRVTVGAGKKQTTVEFVSKEDFLDFLQTKKMTMYESLLQKKDFTGERAALHANISDKINQGIQQGNAEDMLFAFQRNQAAYKAEYEAAGKAVPGEFWDQPTWGKIIKDTTPVTAVDGNVVQGLIAIKESQKLYEQGSDRIVSSVLGEDFAKFFRLSDTDLNRSNRSGVGGGMLSTQNENYGTLASKVQYLGSQTLRKITKTQEATRETLNPSLYALANKPEAAIEWSVTNAKLRQYGSVAYGFDEEARAFKPLAIMKQEAGEADEAMERVIAAFPEDLPLEIPVKHQETVDVILKHLGLNSERSQNIGAIRQHQGVAWKRDPDRFYPIPPNTKDYPYIASVIDDSISGYGRGKMLYAATAEELENMITQVRGADPTLKILTKSDAENWYKSVGQYEFERTLTDVTFDSGIKMKGTSTPYLPATDPQKIVNDTLNWHLSRDSAMVREAVSHLNEAQFATLRTMGEKFAGVKDSHFTKLDPIAYLEMQGKNPYADYIKTALGLTTAKDFPFWTPLNDMLDRKVSALFNKVYESFGALKTPNDLDTINKMLTDAGYQGAAYNAMMYASANHSAPKGALTSFVAKANAILSSTMLGLDPINAVTNMVGSNVLRNSELQSLLRNIKQANPDAVGSLAYMKVPGTGDSVLSMPKMIARAMGEFHGDAGKALRAEFTARGIISSRVDQANWVLDNLALTGRESVKDLDSKIGKVFDTVRGAAAKGEVLTGNKLAEEFNRFVSGHVAKQITDLAVKQGILGEREAWAYINTFVNRVEGNYLAAQRPGVFQGPIGQAIGLFQTYQFNLIQQLLRHVGEGGAKDVAMMMGMQSTIFGMKGLPAFDAINTHLIGNASGNTKHRDLYDAVYGAAGKEAGDWLMYGAGSNALGLFSPDLKFNLYTRGDINPRNVTLLPVNPANIPFVQAAGKFFGAVKETAQKIGAGGNVWGSFLQGIEHAGVSRPLAGLAQTLQATGNPQMRSFSTSNKGNIISSNDFLDLANFIRIAGAKPLDEAIGIDRVYNLEVYAAKDTAKRRNLGEAIKTTVIAGQSPSQEQVDSFAYQYAKAGGRQEKFNQFMMQQFKDANQSQVNKLADNLKSPFSQSMQAVMGGMHMRDFTNDRGL